MGVFTSLGNFIIIYYLLLIKKKLSDLMAYKLWLS